MTLGFSQAEKRFFNANNGLRFTVGLRDNTTISSVLDLFIILMTLR